MSAWSIRGCWCLFLALTITAAAQEERDILEDAPRVFQSPLSLWLYTIRKKSIPSCQDEVPLYYARGRSIGSTPSSDGIVIPLGAMCLVTPSRSSYFGGQQFNPLAAEMRRCGIVGIDLTIEFNHMITDEWITHLGGLDSLQYLALPHAASGITDRSLPVIASLSNLKYLQVTGLPNVSEQGLKCLRSLTQLEQLNLSRMPVTGDVMQELATLSQLQVLELEGCRRLGSGLKEIGELKNLRYLDLRGTGACAMDEHVRALAQLEQLRYLDIRGCQLNPNGLKHLAKLRQLRSLKLEGNTGLDDASLRYLESLCDLRYLNVRQTSVTVDGVEYLQKRLPNLKTVEYDEGISKRRVLWALAIVAILVVILVRWGVLVQRELGKRGSEIRDSGTPASLP